MAEITTDQIIQPENMVYTRSRIMTETVLHYCPGCGHGTVHRLLAEVIEELDLQSETIGITPVGCSVLICRRQPTEGLRLWLRPSSG